MPSEPDWLAPDDIIQLNELVVEYTEEPHLVRDVGLLESAVYRPQQHYAFQDERDTVTLAVILLVGIARNHPFEQGNKRTAFEAAAIFLDQNGFTLEAPDTVEFATLMIEMIERKISDQQFEDIYRSYVRRDDDDELFEDPLFLSEDEAWNLLHLDTDD